MKPNVPLSIKCLIFAALGTGSASADLIWDANGTTVGSPNPFDGAGTWLDADKWWDTTLNAGAGGNFTWNNVTNGASSVQFGNGGLAGVINLAGGVTVGGIQFNAVVMPASPTPGPAGTEEAYSFTGGTLTLGNNAVLDLRNNSSTSNTGNDASASRQARPSPEATRASPMRTVETLPSVSSSSSAPTRGTAISP